MISKVALFAVGRESFALPVEGILQIVSDIRIFTLPLLRRGIHGVFLYQKSTVPLLERRLVAGDRAGDNDAAPAGHCTIVYSTDVGPVGLPVDKILRIVDRSQGRADTVNDKNENGEAAGRVFVCNGERFPLLEVEELVRSLPQ